MMASNPDDSPEFATKGDLESGLEQLRTSVNTDFKAALENGLARFSAGLDQRIDRLEKRMDERMERLETGINQLLSRE